MPQHDFNIANQGFPSFRSDLNDALVALATTSAGPVAPTTPFAGQLWLDTTDSTLKIRNTANTTWQTLFQTTGTGPRFTTPVVFDSTIVASNLLANSYTPTLTAVANVAASTAIALRYTLVGDVVTVLGQVNLTPTAANTDTRLRMTLPIASAFTSGAQAAGSGACLTTGLFGEGLAIIADTTADEFELRCRPTSTAARAYTFTASYRVI